MLSLYLFSFNFTKMKRRCCFLVLSLLTCLWMTGWGQNGGEVTANASPNEICAGGSTTLHAEYTFPDPVVYDFESGMQGWTTIDADGHGNAWSREQSYAHSGSYCMQAYYNANYSHNDYLVSPQITLGEGVFSFYAMKASSIYNDTFRVYLSTTGNSASDFTIELTSGNVNPETDYNKYMYDLSAYEGQGYIAIVYTAAADQYYLCIDDIAFNDNSCSLGVMTFDFDDGTLQGWTNIDADGDGYVWRMINNMQNGLGHNGSADGVFSQSYYSTSISQFALTPDNYLVSPVKITIHEGASISFYACAQDAAYPAEHFGVAVSTTNNTSASAFTTIQEWTMTAKGSGQPTSVTRSGNRTQGNWYLFTTDLSGYAGQSIWVAIRHFNTTDEFYLDVDDIVINDGGITYHWNTGEIGQNVIVSPAVTTNYSVTVYYEDVYLGSAQMTIVVNPLPEVTITTNTGETTICEGDEITLNAVTNYEPPAFYNIGDILCTDGSIVKPADWPIAGKTAKGVVFYVDASGYHGWALGLNESQMSNWCSNTNMGNIPGLIQYHNAREAILDFNGNGNTQLLTDPTSFPAAGYCIGQGGYLPSIGQLNVLFGGLIVINNSLAQLGHTPIPDGSSWMYWSSTVDTSTKVYRIQRTGEVLSVNIKNQTNQYRARPVFDF